MMMKFPTCLLAAGCITAISLFGLPEAWALSPGCLGPQTPAVGEQLGSPEFQAAIRRWSAGILGRLLALKQHRRRTIGAEMAATGIARGQGVKVAVEFCVDRRGAIVAKELIRSSGFRELDSEALAMVARSSPFQPIPTALPVQFLSLVAPIIFHF